MMRPIGAGAEEVLKSQLGCSAGREVCMVEGVLQIARSSGSCPRAQGIVNPDKLVSD